LVDPLRRLALGDPATPARIAALEALGQLGDPREVATLAQVAEQKEPDLVGPAFASLGQIGTRDVVPHFRAALRDGDEPRRLAALRGLSRSPAAAELLDDVRHAAETSGADAARAAVEVLVHVGSRDAVGALLSLSRDPALRAMCVAALARVREEALDAVGAGLADSDHGVRGAVVEALARRKQPSATRLLANALSDPDPRVRHTAERALGRTDLRTAELRSRTTNDFGARRSTRDALAR
jgi:HEAT repeat protein